MRRACVVLLVGLTVGCASQSSADHRLREVEDHYTNDEARVAELSIVYPRLRGEAARVTELHARAAQELEIARLAWRDAERLNTASAATLRQAERDAADAIRNYRLATAALLAMASGRAVCASTETTAQIRARLRGEGFDLSGLDVDHMFPRSLGGVDHPLNYQLLESSLNRSLGNDLFAKLMQAPVGVLQGLLVSVLGRLGGC